VRILIRTNSQILINKMFSAQTYNYDIRFEHNEMINNIRTTMIRPIANTSSSPVGIPSNANRHPGILLLNPQ